MSRAAQLWGWVVGRCRDSFLGPMQNDLGPESGDQPYCQHNQLPCFAQH